MEQNQNNNLVLLRAFFSFLFIVLGARIFGEIIGIQIITWIYHIESKELIDFLNHPADTGEDHNKLRVALLTYQGFAAFISFIGGGLLYLRWQGKKTIKSLSKGKINVWYAGIIVLVTLMFMPFNAMIIDWNMNIQLPNFMKSWAIAKEEQLNQLTQFLTDFSSLREVILGLVVIAIIPAIGEELVFRGILQNLIHSTTKKAHLAIWVTAFFFAALHMQFLTFFPRFLLGAMFGYIYYWSGNLYYPIIAHFVNNAFTLLMIYAFHRGQTNFNIEESNTISPLFSWITLTFVIFLLFLLRKFFKSNAKLEKNI